MIHLTNTLTHSAHDRDKKRLHVFTLKYFQLFSLKLIQKEHKDGKSRKIPI